MMFNKLKIQGVSPSSCKLSQMPASFCKAKKKEYCYWMCKIYLISAEIMRQTYKIQSIKLYNIYGSRAYKF